jgi:hypothetical protein
VIARDRFRGLRVAGWPRCFFASLVLLAPRTALAQQVSDARVTLEWRAPASCPDGNAVLAKVRALVSAASAERVTALGVVTEPAAGGRWQLTLETVQGARTWQRSLHAASCDELADAGALIIALVLDPNLEVQAGGDSAAPAGTTPGPAPPDAQPASRPAPAARPAARRPAPALPPDATLRRQPPPERAGTSATLGGHAALSAVADWGSLPGMTLGGELAGGVAIDPIELELSAMILPPVREVVAENPERGGRLTLATGGLRGCYVVGWSKLSGRVCGGFEVGRIHGNGFGSLDYRNEQNSLWIAGRLGVFGRYPLIPPLALRFGLEGVVPARRPEFVLDNVEAVQVSVHEPSPAVLRLALGFELLFR